MGVLMHIFHVRYIFSSISVRICQHEETTFHLQDLNVLETLIMITGYQDVIILADIFPQSLIVSSHSSTFIRNSWRVKLAKLEVLVLPDRPTSLLFSFYSTRFKKKFSVWYLRRLISCVRKISVSDLPYKVDYKL